MIQPIPAPITRNGATPAKLVTKSKPIFVTFNPTPPTVIIRKIVATRNDIGGLTTAEYEVPLRPR